MSLLRFGQKGVLHIYVTDYMMSGRDVLLGHMYSLTSMPLDELR